MAMFQAPENISVDDFFKDLVPRQFKETLEGADMSVMAGKDFTLQFDVDGKKYCLKVKDGKDLEIIEGGIEKPMLGIQISEDFWRDSVTGKIEAGMDQFTDPQQAADAARYAALQSTSGTLKAELTKPDGSIAKLAMVFNGAASPESVIKLSLSDWAAMQSKEVDGQTLVMGGKMQFSGDMMFLMALQNLM